MVSFITKPIYFSKDDVVLSIVNFNSAVVIPAINPIPDLVKFIEQLLKNGVARIIVVNDGSNSTFNYVFSEIKKLAGCIVLEHKVNMGKGRALKTAFSYFSNNCPNMDGVVTADADGQHSVEDICKVCEMLSTLKNTLILGVRNFKNKNVPKRSYMGNWITSHIFHLLYGTYLNDTQTGLRGIPAEELSWLLDLKGERYDYEINMLIKARQLGLSYTIIPIETLYFDNNSGSHYSTIKDSARIFKCLIAGLVTRSGVKS
jgi:glycosyltransferase involved in cell wall biosynthesis